MRRDERVRAALDGYIASDEPGTTHADAMGLALDAALADIGRLDGLDDTLRALAAAQASSRADAAECEALRADRDRLREALRVVALTAPGSLNGREAEAALAESEGGS